MVLTPQIDSFIPGWAYDEPKKKKKTRPPGTKSKRSKKDAVSGVSAAIEDAGGELTPAKAEDGSGDADEPIKATTTATESQMVNGLRNRQSATVEEIDDEE